MANASILNKNYVSPQIRCVHEHQKTLHSGSVDTVQIPGQRKAVSKEMQHNNKNESPKLMENKKMKLMQETSKQTKIEDNFIHTN